MKVRFANGKIYDASDVDDAIAQCLAAGDDPFNPEVLAELVEKIKKEKKPQNADTVEQ